MVIRARVGLKIVIMAAISPPISPTRHSVFRVEASPLCTVAYTAYIPLAKVRTIPSTVFQTVPLIVRISVS